MTHISHIWSVMASSVTKNLIIAWGIFVFIQQENDGLLFFSMATKNRIEKERTYRQKINCSNKVLGKRKLQIAMKHRLWFIKPRKKMNRDENFYKEDHYLMAIGPNPKKIPQNSGKQIWIPEGM